MYRRHLAKLPARYQVTIDVRDSDRDDFLVVMSVVSLLADGRIEQDNRAAYKVDQFFVYKVGASLVLIALVTCRFCS